mgnify:FL=1
MEGVEPPTLWFVAIDSHPLSYIPYSLQKKWYEGTLNIINRRTTGIEPAHDGATNHYLTPWWRPPSKPGSSYYVENSSSCQYKFQITENHIFEASRPRRGLHHRFGFSTPTIRQKVDPFSYFDSSCFLKIFNISSCWALSQGCFWVLMDYYLFLPSQTGYGFFYSFQLRCWIIVPILSLYKNLIDPIIFKNWTHSFNGYPRQMTRPELALDPLGQLPSAPRFQRSVLLWHEET